MGTFKIVLTIHNNCILVLWLLLGKYLGKELDIVVDNEFYKFTEEMFGKNWEIKQDNFLLSQKKFSFVRKIKIAKSVNCMIKITLHKSTTTFPYTKDYRSFYKT